MASQLQRHHRRPKSLGGSNAPSNISLVDAHQHAAYHRIFGNRTAHEVAHILNKTWIDPNKVLICVDRVDSEIISQLLDQIALICRR